MNRQEIYNNVKNHLLTQGVQSLKNGECAYRGDNGTACALGILILPEFYSRDLEGGTPNWPDSKVNHALEKSLNFKISDKTDVNFLNSLQEVHDCYEPQYWSKQLTEIANKWGLTP